MFETATWVGTSRSRELKSTWGCPNVDSMLKIGLADWWKIRDTRTFRGQVISLHFPDAQLGHVGFFFAASEWRNLQFAFRQPLVTKNLQSSHGRSILPKKNFEKKFWKKNLKKKFQLTISRIWAFLYLLNLIIVIIGPIQDAVRSYTDRFGNGYVMVTDGCYWQAG